MNFSLIIATINTIRLIHLLKRLRSLFLPSLVFMSIVGNCFAQERPNIILVLIENISTDLGCYGCPTVKTPNVDKLASEGVRYTHAFTTNSTCGPSRAAIALGAYQIKTNAHHCFMNSMRPVPEPYRLFTHYLREAGYYSAVGCGFHDKTNFMYKPKDGKYKGFDGKDWKDRKPGQPFFAQTTMMITHRNPSWKKVDSSLPKISPDDVKLPAYLPDHPVCRGDWAEYLMQIQKMDAHVGQLMKRLEDEDLKDNTVVIFMADNGRDCVRGMEWLYDPGIHVPLIIRWPGYLQNGVICEDLVSAVDITATILDIAGITIPSHMDGLPLFKAGTPKREHVFAARDRVDNVLDRIRCVRTKEYKYIRNYMPKAPRQWRRWIVPQDPTRNLLLELNKQGKLTWKQSLMLAQSKPEEELYDINNDPGEYNNLAQSPEYSDVLKSMRKKIDTWVEVTNDAGQHHEKQEEMEESEWARYDEVYGK